jgi:hypothetical protein
MNAKSVSLAVWSSGFIACASLTGSDAHRVTLSTDLSDYAGARYGRVTLTNEGPHAVYGDLCNTLTVERLDGTTWLNAGDFGKERVILLPNSIPRLEPGASWDWAFEIVAPPFTALGGTFRLRVPVSDLKTGEAWDVLSPAFTVAP